MRETGQKVEGGDTQELRVRTIGISKGSIWSTRRISLVLFVPGDAKLRVAWERAGITLLLEPEVVARAGKNVAGGPIAVISGQLLRGS